MTYSIIIPLKDEAGSLLTLYKELTVVLNKLNKPYEIIFVDDGSTDNSSKIITNFQKSDKNIKLIKFRANFGKSEALSSGFRQARGKAIITLDADLQDDPQEIPNLIKKMNEGYDLVNGWRLKRADSLTKKISSFLFNRGTSLIAGVKLHDFNCGLKVFKKEVANELYLQGELHRFIPVLAFKKKFKVTEIAVNHRQRQFGKSKYGKHGLGRSWKAVIDLLTSIFITDYSTKPAHFFGKIGLLFFSVGFIMDGCVTYIKVTTGTTQGRIPLLLAGILFILIGIQLISTGLIAEMISYYFLKNKEPQTEA